MTETLPWVKWRFDKWRGDEGLRVCGLAARGLWIELLAIMHGGQPYGHLAINGRAPSSKQIASLVGMTSEKEVVALLRELEEAGVSSRSEDGLIYCRRMIRDNAARIAGKETGSRGGNPTLMGDKTHMVNGGGNPDGITEGVNPPRKPREREREEKEEQEPSLRSGGARACRLPADWQPDDEGRLFAIEAGLDPDRVAAQFRDHWHAKPGKDGTKLDWAATWRNWCRNEPGMRRVNGTASARGDPKAGRRAAFALPLHGDILP